ncbi:tyrosine kinase receptor Cad96Ca [Rhodnius prolixus]|uniref:tyrosine kinase receptor Cad96Ca n=1 Tax=Rhodnius prolixus TaxID=13249 RepID=UPI003D18AA5F
MLSVFFWNSALIFCFITTCIGELDNAPPVLRLNRKWEIQETEPVGSVVTRVYGSDTEGDHLVYGLERLNEYNLEINDTRPLPFRIDNSTGVVYTNQSLVGRAGENVFLYVTVTDGKLTQKSAVWAIILAKDGSASGLRPAQVPLQFSPDSMPRPPLMLAPPLRTVLAKSRPPASTTTQQPTTSTAATTASSSSSPPSNSKSTTGQPELDDFSSQRPELASGQPTQSRPNVVDIALTVVPVTLVCILFALATIVIYLFRKKICSTKKKPSKEEMQKKASNGVTEEPMVLHHWRGPRAFSNRYTAWDTELGPNFAPQDTSLAPPTKTQDRWEFPRHQLKVFNILGEGCFGQVWKCEAKHISGEDGPTIVAVKTLKENAGERERIDLLQELQVMKLLDPHPNVVRLLGCCTDKDPIFVIMEYVSNGKLQSFLRNSRATRSYDNMHGKSNTLTSRHLTSFCYQIARGMQFLSSKGIIHRDLAARNILVSADHTCKVADFGFARDIIGSHVYERKSEGRLPIRWMAPESLYDNVFSVKSDAWSFGVLVWEIVTLGSTPYPGLSAPDVMKKVKEGYRLDKPEHCRRELYNIMFYCWNEDPKERPDFTELVDLLEQLLLSETDYIELQRFPDHSYYNIVSLSGEKV